MRASRWFSHASLALPAALLALAAAEPGGTAKAADSAPRTMPSALAAPERPWALREPAARPTEHVVATRHGHSRRKARHSPACAGRFCVHWVDKGPDAPDLTDADGHQDGDGVPDYVERVLDVAAHVYSVENERLGWREPRSDGRLGGKRGKTDVYLKELGRMIFGYAAPDANQGPRGDRIPRRLHGYLVLDNDYSSRQYPGTDPLEALQVTFAHEYCHILQMGYDAYQDAWLAESTAVWMEEQVYGDIDDYLRYVRRWTRLYKTPLTADSIRQYGAAVWSDWLSRRYGAEVVRSAWSRAVHTRPGGFSVSAYDAAIRAAGGSGLSRDFARFAADVAEWRSGDRFSEAVTYPDVPRQGSLSLDGQRLRRSLDHGTFQLLQVPRSADRAVAVTADAPRGVAAGLALVGREGGEADGRVVVELDFSRRGGRLAVSLGNPERFQRLTAVIVNADMRTTGFSPDRLDWIYLTDTAPFSLAARSLP